MYLRTFTNEEIDCDSFLADVGNIDEQVDLRLSTRTTPRTRQGDISTLDNNNGENPTLLNIERGAGGSFFPDGEAA